MSFPPNRLCLSKSLIPSKFLTLSNFTKSNIKSKKAPHLPTRNSAIYTHSNHELHIVSHQSPPTQSIHPKSPILSMASFKQPNPFCTSQGRCTSGEVHVIVGPMFAGKTTSLLRRIKSEVDNGRNVAMLKSSKDTRYAIDSVVTHDGIGFPCWALPDLLSFRENYGDDAYQKLDVIGIDEAQFFGDLYEFCCQVADNDGKIVIVAGLDGDYLRRSFGSVLHIIPLADTVTKLTARCEQCGKRAFFTLRKTQETQTELIGGADVYMPVCRFHYMNSELVSETSRNVLESHKANSNSLLEAAPVV